MDQQFFNIVVSVAGFLGGWVLYVIWSSIQKLQEQSNTLLSELNQVKILVAGNYTPRETFDRTVHVIYQKIDTKVDKP